MKKAVVYMLTAIVVTGSCIAPTVAYATEPDKPVVSEEKTEENTPVVVTETPKEEDNTNLDNEETSDKVDKPSQEETSDNKTDKPSKEETSDKTDKPSQEETKPQEGQKPEQKPEKPQEEKKELEKLPLTQNINSVKNYVSSLTKLYNTSFFLKKDAIIIGYTCKGGVSDGFILPEVFNSRYSDSYIWGKSNDDGTEFIWNKLTDIYTLEELTSYVRKNISSLGSKAGEKASDKILQLGPPIGRPQSLIVFDGKTGDYVGSFQMINKDCEDTYDASVAQLSGKITPSVTYNKDKTKATLSFDFNVEYPASMGGAQFLHFDMYSADKTDYFFTSTDALPYVKGVSGKASGTVKDVPVNKSGDLLLKVNTTQGSLEIPFSVDKLNEPKDEGVTGEAVKPKVTFSSLKKGILDGTPTTITMYSDVDAILMFNGESSPTACKEYTFTVRHNGAYNYVAQVVDGGETPGVFTVDCFVEDKNAIDFGTYNQSGTTFLPQTGGMSTLAVTLSGVFLMIGGIAIAKKDALMAMIRNHGRKVC